MLDLFALGLMRIPQVGPAFARDFFGHIAAPFCDFGVVARLQNLGDRAIVPDRGFGVLRVF